MKSKLVAFVFISIFYSVSFAQQSNSAVKKMSNEWIARKNALELQKKLGLTNEQTLYIEQIELAKLILEDQWAAFDKAEILAAIEARKAKLNYRNNVKKNLSDSINNIFTVEQIEKLNEIKELQEKEEAEEKERQINKILEYQKNRRKQNEEKKEILQLMPISIPKPKNTPTGN